MQEIGEKERFFDTSRLKPIHYTERPEALPSLSLDDRVYAGVDNGKGEVMYLLEEGQAALDEAQSLWDKWKANRCKAVTFYIGS